MPLMTIVIFRGLSLLASFSRLRDKKLVQALCFSKYGKLSLLQRQVVMTTYAISEFHCVLNETGVEIFIADLREIILSQGEKRRVFIENGLN